MKASTLYKSYSTHSLLQSSQSFKFPTTSQSGDGISSELSKDKKVIVLSDSQESGYFTGPQSRALINNYHPKDSRLKNHNCSQRQRQTYSSNNNDEIFVQFNGFQGIQDAVLQLSSSEESSDFLQQTFKTEKFQNRSIFDDFQNLRITKEYAARIKHENSIKSTRDRFRKQNKKRTQREGR